MQVEINFNSKILLVCPNGCEKGAISGGFYATLPAKVKNILNSDGSLYDTEGDVEVVDVVENNDIEIFCKQCDTKVIRYLKYNPQQIDLDYKTFFDNYVEKEMQGKCGLVQSLAEEAIKRMSQKELKEVYKFFILKEDS